MEYPTKRYCDFCKKWIECKVPQSFGGHVSTCKYNPYSKILRETSRKAQNHEKKKYTIICKKCSKSFELYLTLHNYKKGNYRKHCSYKCSNSRIQTPEMNESRMKKLTKTKINVKCVICGKQFSRKEHRGKTCSHRCNCKHISNIQKESYKNGREITNGTTKWLPYKNISVQGTYELRTCKILDKWKIIGKIKDWEYTKDRFPYIGIDKKEHTYFMDFKVFNYDETFYYIETKGYKKEKDKLKWKSVRDLGYILEVWFENNIKTIEAQLV